MANELLMPKQGNTVESCIILEWHKNEGDIVATGDVVCEVETDKATFEVESTHDGTILKTYYEEGDDVPVMTPIAVIGEEGEDISGLGPKEEAKEQEEEQGDESGKGAEAAPSGEAAKPAETKPAEATAAKTPSPEEAPATTGGAAASGSGNGKSGAAVSPRAKNFAAAAGIDPTSLAGSGPSGRVIERDIQAARKGMEPLTPAAIAEVKASGKQPPAAGSGLGGRVTAEDVREAAPGAKPGAARSAAIPAAAGEFPGPTRETPVKGVRKVIAQRMLESLTTTAQLTLNSSAAAGAILAYRKKLKESPEELGLKRVTINDLILFAVSRVLPQFPFMNAHFKGESIVEFDRVHLGFAVDTPKGLMVPNIKNADLLSLRQISAETKRLSVLAQEGKATPDDLSGRTFTVTNLGALGVENFTPVLNPPEVGILGVSSIQLKPVRKNGEVEYADSLGLSLTINHQAVDGAPGARFLKAFSQQLAVFELLLAE